MSSEDAKLDQANKLDVVPVGNDSDSKREKDDLFHRRFKSELGWLGCPFGGRAEKPGNLSGLVLLLAFGFLFAAYFNKSEHLAGIEFKDILFVFASIITLILGYLFGSNDRSRGND